MILKKLICLFLCLAAITMLLCACDEPTDADREEPKTNDTSKKPETTTAKPTETSKLPETTPSTPDEPTVPAWKTAYLDLLEQMQAEWDRLEYEPFYDPFALIYVDNDDIPELYVMGICQADGDTVYSYKNGQMVKQQLNRNGGGSYIERGSVVVNRNGAQGMYYTDVYKLDAIGFAQTFTALSIERVVSRGDEDYDFVYEYFIGDTPVTEDEYRAALNDAFDSSKTVAFRDKAVSYEVIKQQLGN